MVWLCSNVAFVYIFLPHHRLTLDYLFFYVNLASLKTISKSSMFVVVLYDRLPRIHIKHERSIFFFYLFFFFLYNRRNTRWTHEIKRKNAKTRTRKQHSTRHTIRQITGSALARHLGDIAKSATQQYGYIQKWNCVKDRMDIIF